MLNRLCSVSALVILLMPCDVSAQAASFGTFGAGCPSNARLYVSGLPKMGGSFKVQGIRYPGNCGRKPCACSCCFCNFCSGSVLIVGLSRRKTRLPTGCSLLITTDYMLLGDRGGEIRVSVPTSPNLAGFKFYMQWVGVWSRQRGGRNCPTTYVPLALNLTSNGVIGTIGV